MRSGTYRRCPRSLLFAAVLLCSVVARANDKSPCPGPDCLAEIDAWFAERDLPRHPLFDLGYMSVGCHTCTRAVAPGEDVRAGRWANLNKTECGIYDRPAPADRG